MDQMISEVKSLSTKVELSKTFEKVDHNQHGKIYVSNVSVVYEKKKLCVIQKVSFIKCLWNVFQRNLVIVFYVYCMYSVYNF